MINKGENIQERTYKFAIEVVMLVRKFPKNSEGFAMSSQLIRSDTSVPANLSLGNHTITLTAIDSTGNSASASIIISVIIPSANNNPALTIINPNNGDNFSCNSPINFQAIATDPDGDNVTVTWTSSIDSQFGNGTNFIVSNLTCGANHTIFAVASDGRGGINQSQININVAAFFNPAPDVQITAPLNGTQFIRDCGTVSFSATATAFGGANITTYSWIYNGNLIGNTSSFSVPAATFALGNQSISLQVYDDLGGTSIASVTIEIIPLFIL